MNIGEKIEDLRKEFNNKIDKLEEEYKKEKDGKWIPREEEKYFFVTIDKEVDYYDYRNDIVDEKILKYNKIFKTKEEAQEYADYLKAIKEYSYELGKYYIYYDLDDKVLHVGSIEYLGRMGTIYFKTLEKAQEFLDIYREQILKFEFDIGEE